LCHNHKQQTAFDFVNRDIDHITNMFHCGRSLPDDDDVVVVQGTNRDPIAVSEPIGAPVETPLERQYRGLLTEVDLINTEVTNVRKQLWEAQDKLKEKDDKIRKLETHVQELLDQREKDVASIKELKEANADLVEEETKVRESLDLMKKVLTRAELKVKEDEETISLLKQERKSLLQVAGVSKQSNLNLTAIDRIKEASAAREEKYKELLNEAEAEIDEYKDRHAKAAKLVNHLRAQLAAVEDPTGAAAQLEKQRRMIDALEEQIIELEIEEMEKEDERSDTPVYDHSVVHRSILDEDFEDSRLRRVIERLDCRQCRQ
jgi:chromosome segregation ATPase